MRYAVIGMPYHGGGCWGRQAGTHRFRVATGGADVVQDPLFVTFLFLDVFIKGGGKCASLAEFRARCAKQWHGVANMMPGLRQIVAIGGQANGACQTGLHLGYGKETQALAGGDGFQLRKELGCSLCQPGSGDDIAPQTAIAGQHAIGGSEMSDLAPFCDPRIFG